MILGAWVNTGSFADQRFNTQGALLAIAGGAPLQHQGNDAIYGVVDQMLWRVPGPGDRSLNFFMRAMAAPGDRNLIDVYTDGGFAFKGLIERRANDTTGLGFAVGRISPAGAAFDRDLAAALGQASPVRGFRGRHRIDLSMEARGQMVRPTGPAVHFPPRRQYRQPARPDRPIGDPERAGVGDAHGHALLSRVG